jgi:hypothetical protein
MAWRGGVGSSIPDLNKDLKEFADPIGGKKKYLAVPALRSPVRRVELEQL